MIEFKSEEEREEFEDARLNNKLKNIIKMMSIYTNIRFDKNIIVTEVYRAQEEQDRVYKDNEKYRESPWKSTHQFWRAVDLRSWTFEENEIEEILDILNKIPYDINRPQKKTAIYHKTKYGAKHIHIQVYI